MNTVVGIFFDPREPPPPELRGLQGRHRQRIPFRDHTSAVAQRQRRRPQPPPLPASPAYPRPQEVNDPPQLLPHPPPPQDVLPPLSVSMVARIVHDTAKVSVTQTFWNGTGSDIPKGAYTFPLSAGCTVVDFSCRVGRDRIVRGRVKPKREAREAFNHAARENQPAGLLEQETPEIFTTTLANIPANTKLEAEISFITLLKHRFADNSVATTLTIPTYIASRYGTPPQLQPVLMPSTSKNLTIRVEVLTTEPIKSIKSKTHHVDWQMGVGRGTCQSWNEFVTRGRTEDPRMAVVEFAGGSTYLDRDFVLDITTLPQDGLETPHACMEIHPSFKNHKAVMLTIPPKFMLRNQSRVHDAEVLFVADRSGSMSDKMESLKSAMEFFLRGIQAQHFNVWCFGSKYTHLWPRSKGYSASTLREALSHVSKHFRSDMGGTELLPALKAIVNAREGYRMTDVVLLTDGEVWRLDETIRFIQQTRMSTKGRVRFFALGIGDAVSHELVEGIAKAGGGYAEVIPAASQGGWEDRIVAVLHATLTGHIGPLRVEFDGVDGQAATEPLSQPQLLEASTTPTRPHLSQSPANISTSSPFLRNRVFILVDSTTSLATLDAINIRATAPDGGEMVTRVPVKTLSKSDSTIHKLGARALLGDLERGQSWIQLNPRSSSRHTPEEEITRREGERLGCKWSLVSKWTSFYAIEEVYQAQEGAQDPFLDPDNPQIHHITNNDLDLLRQRGVPGQHVRNPMIALPVTTGALSSEGTEEYEDSTSESDSPENEHDSDSGGDDGGSDHYGDGGGNLGGDTGGHQQGRDSTRDGRPEQERDAADGRGDPQHGSYDGFLRERTHNPYFARNNSPTFQMLFPAPSTAPSIAPTTARSRDIDIVASTSNTRHPKHVNLHNRSELPNLGASKEKFEKPVGSWTDSSMSPTKARASLPFLARRDRPEPTRAISTKHHISSPFKRPTRERRSTSIERSTVAEPTEKSKYSFASEYRKGGGDYFAPKAQSPTIPLTMKKDWGPEMKAPSHNPPASTSILPIISHAPKSVEDAADEALVRRLINFQLFDGSFLLDLNDIDELFGEGFRLAVQELQTSGALVDCSPDDPAILAATIAIIILLEEAFQSCKSLWLLMEIKARDYVDLWVPGSCKQELFAFARERFLRVHIQGPVTRFPRAAPLSDQSTGRAVSASDARGPPVSRRSLLREGIKKFRSAKPEAEPVTQNTGLRESTATDDREETTSRPVEPPKGPPNSSSSIRQSWQRMKTFRSKTEPRTTPHPETPRQKELLTKEGWFSRSGITSSGKDVSSFFSTKKSRIEQNGESPSGEIGQALGEGANPLEMRLSRKPATILGLEY